MFEKEEQELIKLNKKINAAPKPENMELYIKNGIKLGIKRKQRNKVKHLANIAAILIFTILITSIRVSPAFASYSQKIPGLGYVANLVNYDKGIKDVEDNNFVQPVNISVEKEGMVVTLKDMIIDNSKAILYFTIENKSTHKFAEISSLKVKNEKGEELSDICPLITMNFQDKSKEKILNKSIEMNFKENTILPEKFIFDLKLGGIGEPGGNGYLTEYEPTWSYEVPINKNNFKDMQKTYTINKYAKIQGQRILFKTARITPTRISVDVEYDKKNTKKLLKFEDIGIINEKGEKWSPVLNTSDPGIRIDDNHETLYFQSNYYSKSKHLYLTGTSLRAIDKDKSILTVDIKNNKLINAPDDKLKLESITTENSQTAIKLKLESDEKIDENIQYNIFPGTFKDGDKKSRKQVGGMFMALEYGIEHLGYDIPSDTKSPIYLTLEDYPLRIKGNFKIKIK